MIIGIITQGELKIEAVILTYRGPIDLIRQCGANWRYQNTVYSSKARSDSSH